MAGDRKWVDGSAWEPSSDSDKYGDPFGATEPIFDRYGSPLLLIIVGAEEWYDSPPEEENGF